MTSHRAAWRYHAATSHSSWSVVGSRRSLDWVDRPLPYKIYPTLGALPLPLDGAASDVPALDAIAGRGARGLRSAPSLAGRVPDLEAIARLCRYSNGITRRRPVPGGEIAFRAAGTTGALYHIELYLVCGDLPGLDAGVYHYGAHADALYRLRPGDYRGVVVEATGAEPSVASAPVVIVCTSTFWRNAWKYEARAYRHSFWDGGTVLANLLAIAAARELPTRVVLGFADRPVERLLDVDPDREGAVALVAVGRDGDVPPSPDLTALRLPIVPLSRREVEYAEIREMHRASSLSSGEAAAAWRGRPLAVRHPRWSGDASIKLDPPPPTELPEDSIEHVIRRRGSTRRFRREGIGFRELSTILDRSMDRIPADCVDGSGRLLAEPYLLVNAVDRLAPGSYFLALEERRLDPLEAGAFRALAGRLALGQDLAADAAADLYLLTDLEPLLDRFGDRGYRAAQLTSAIAAGRAWLAAYALGLGATGLTFFDDEVTRFFSPHAEGKSVMFLLAVGRPRR